MRASRYRQSDGNDDWSLYFARAHNVPLTVLERMAAHARNTTTASGAPFHLGAFFPGADAPRTRLANAWHGRAVANAGDDAVHVLVGGYAGSGKTEFARFLP